MQSRKSSKMLIVCILKSRKISVSYFYEFNNSKNAVFVDGMHKIAVTLNAQIVKFSEDVNGTGKIIINLDKKL